MQLKLLWDLQEMDLSVDDLTTKLEDAPICSGIAETTELLENLRIELSEQEEKLRVDQKTLKQLEMKVMTIDDDRKEISDSLYGGKVNSAKELEQMQKKLDLLTAEKKNLEDRIISMMESVEEQEEVVRSTVQAVAESTAELRDKEKKLEAEQKSLNQELTDLALKRSQLAEQIDSRYMEKYNILALKNQGRAMAKIENDICSACRVFISSAQRGHLYNPSAMVYCENCGRLLVRFDNGISGA